MHIPSSVCLYVAFSPNEKDILAMFSSMEGYSYPVHQAPLPFSYSRKPLQPLSTVPHPYFVFFCSIFVRSLLSSSLSFKVLYFTYLPLYLAGCSVTFSLSLPMRLLISGTPNFIFHYSVPYFMLITTPGLLSVSRTQQAFFCFRTFMHIPFI